MPIPTDARDRAAYHSMLSEMHRLQAVMLSMAAVAEAGTEAAMSEHFGREQRLALGKLSEWRLHRPEIYADASADFAAFMGTGGVEAVE